MSYSEKYRIESKKLDGNITTVIITEKNYAGYISTLMPAARNFCEITTDGDINNIFGDGVISSGISIKFIPEPLSVNFFTDDPQKYIINVFSGDTAITPFWQGFISQNVYLEPFDTNKPQVEIQGNDGMLVLENMYYIQNNGSFFTGTATLGQIIKNILAKISGLTFNNVYTCIDYSYSYFDTNIFTNLKYDQQNFIDEQLVAQTCKQVLQSIFRGLAVVQIIGQDLYIYNPELLNGSYGKKYTLPNFVESTYAIGGCIDVSGTTISRFQTGAVKDNIPCISTAIVNYDPYTFLSYSYDFNDKNNLKNADSWGHITTPSKWFNNNTVQFSGWTQSSHPLENHFVAAAEDIDGVKGDPTYMLFLTNTNLYDQPILTLSLPSISIYNDSTLSLKISLDSWFQTKENNYNIFSPATGNQVYGYYIQTSLKIGNQYYNGSTWTTDFTHNLIAVKSCTSSEFGTNPANSTANDTWITASVIIPLNSSLVGSENIEFCIYDYWNSSQSVTQRKNFAPVIGILLKNLKIEVVNTNTGQLIDNSGIQVKGTPSTNILYNLKPVEISTTTGTGKYSVSKGAIKDVNNNNNMLGLMDKDTSEVFISEKFILRNILSEYLISRQKLTMSIKLNNIGLNVWLKLITNNKYLQGKKFYIVNSTYNDAYKSMNVELIEIPDTRETIT